jgi:hypothetical protein
MKKAVRRGPVTRFRSALNLERAVFRLNECKGVHGLTRSSLAPSYTNLEIPS